VAVEWLLWFRKTTDYNREIAMFKLFARKWGIRKEGNITVATKEGWICNEVSCFDLIMHCYLTVFLAPVLLIYGDISYWLKSLTILHI